MTPNELPTPYWLVDQRRLLQNIKTLGGALATRLPGTVVAYSVKTNPLPWILDQMRQNAIMAEVVSAHEYRHALKNGFLSHDMVYNGPLKDRETFVHAVSGGTIVNIETKRELDWLEDMHPAGTEILGLRVNVNVNSLSPQDAAGDDDNSRFGFVEATGELAAAIERLDSKGFRLSGLHMHRNVRTRSIRFYEALVDYAATIIERYRLEPEYLDLGGGLYGIDHNKPTFDQYADAIAHKLRQHGLANIKVILEPGYALVSNVMTLVTQVIDTKQLDEDIAVVITDAIRADIDPFYRERDHGKQIVYRDTRGVRPRVRTQTVCGCTCIEYDRMMTIRNGYLLQPGDRILYTRAGAYTLTMTPTFIRSTPDVYVITLSGDIKLVQKGRYWE